MPAKVARTATVATRYAWTTAEPGDIFFTKAAGAVGLLIGRGTGSPYAHCGIIHGTTTDRLRWYTAEAFPVWPPWKAGLRWRSRPIDSVASVVRVWRTEQERDAILRASGALTKSKPPYAWSEIGLIAAATVLPHRLIPNIDFTRSVICSNHVAQAIRAARPDDYARYFRYPPHHMWPGGLHYDLQAMLWDDRYALAA